MRRLYLHIGHSKTGSSFLQSSFANSTEVLAQMGIGYPQAPSPSRAGAEDWRISSGNGDQLLHVPADRIAMEHEHGLFSSEGLFQALLEDPANVAKILTFCTHHNIAEVKVLLFLRDPIPHAESTYQQMVKRGGATFDVAHIFDTYRMPELTRWILTLELGDIPIQWHIHNFDRNRAGLLPIAERFLGVPAGSLATGEGRVVNRSMTASEIAFLRAMNGHDPSLSRKIADALCDELPDIPAEPIFPASAVQQAMLRRQADAISEVNARLPATEHYATELRLETPVGGQVTFSQRQIDVIAGAVGADSTRKTARLAEMQTQRLLQMVRGNLAQGRLEKARDLLGRLPAGLADIRDEEVLKRTRAEILKLRERLEEIEAKSSSKPQEPT